MDFFLWNVAGNVDDRDLCFVEDFPEGMGAHGVKLAIGKPAMEHVPERPRIKLREEHPGLALPGFIGNTSGMLLLSRAGLAVLEELCPEGKREVFPFELINHKNRVHSADYVIVNPLDLVPCLDEQASGVKRNKNGDVDLVEKHVLSRHKVENAPHLFRMAEAPVEYVFSRALGRAFNAAGISNVRGAELRQS